MSVQTGVQNGSVLALVASAGCQDVRGRKRQREREREQSARWCRLSTGRSGEGREGACLGSFHTASLNWCFESRNVSSSGTCFVCLHFQTYISTPQQVISLRMQNHEHTDAHRGGPECRGCSLFGGNLTLHAVATLGIYVRVVELSEMERVHTFVSLTFSPSSSGHGSSQSSWRADLFSRLSGQHAAFKARGTVSALYTETRKLCSCPQIGVCVSLGPVSYFARVSDSN